MENPFDKKRQNERIARLVKERDQATQELKKVKEELDSKRLYLTGLEETVKYLQSRQPYNFSKAVYEQNVKVGWHEHKDGTPFTAEEQDAKFPERIALIHSEVSEALEGWRTDEMDSKLPEWKNRHIELADAYIRIAELAYLEGFDLQAAAEAKFKYNKDRADHKRENRAKQGGKRI